MLRTLGFSRTSLNVIRGNYIKNQNGPITFSKRFRNSFENFPKPHGLYEKSLEKDSCGVGLVAQMKKIASRQIVLDANEMLVRMSHRGGCGCEVNSGDGAGKIFALCLVIKYNP